MARRILTALVALHATLAPAVTIDEASPDSIRNAARAIAAEMMGYYVGDQPGQTPGYLPGSGQEGGYFWWVGGAMFGTMINYYRTTGDDTWLAPTMQAIEFQSDPTSGGFFDSANVSAQLGNDDQAFWAFAAMMAAEYKLPDPSPGYPSWLAMAQGVFNQQTQRWDPLTCNGGMRWQVFPFNNGYNYKNSISNGCFFQLAARLGKYTGNSTYTDEAIKYWDWSFENGLIDPTTYAIIDGIVVENCGSVGHTDRWTYNVGVYLYGAAALWNITQNQEAYASQADTWRTHTQGLIDACDVFFQSDTQNKPMLTEVICEPQNTCKVDSSTFKAYLARWLRATAQVAPWSADQITALLQPSVQGVAMACSGPPTRSGDGAACGQQWYTDGFDGRTGIGMQMNALEVITTLLPNDGPVIEAEGISKSDPSAGTSPVGVIGGGDYKDGVIEVTTADKAGASILTILLGAVTLTGAWWLIK